MPPSGYPYPAAAPGTAFNPNLMAGSPTQPPYIQPVPSYPTPGEYLQPTPPSPYPNLVGASPTSYFGPGAQGTPPAYYSGGSFNLPPQGPFGYPLYNAPMGEQLYNPMMPMGGGMQSVNQYTLPGEIDYTRVEGPETAAEDG